MALANIYLLLTSETTDKESKNQMLNDWPMVTLLTFLQGLEYKIFGQDMVPLIIRNYLSTCNQLRSFIIFYICRLQDVLFFFFFSKT